MVYGYLGNKWFPLAASAYTAISQQFPVCNKESFTGFDLHEETKLTVFLLSPKLLLKMSKHSFNYAFFVFPVTVEMNEIET